MRRTTVVIAGVLLLAAVTAIWWVAGGPARQGTTATGEQCPADSVNAAFPSPAREGLDRFVVPVGPVPVAPLRAVVCRYGAGGVLVAGLWLDPARTAALAGAVAAPLVPLPGGWPSDALAAKRIPPLTGADLATLAAPVCPSDPGAAPTDVVTFTYPKGPQVAVRVRTGPCRDLSNGTITVRTPERVLTALAALPLSASGS